MRSCTGSVDGGVVDGATGSVVGGVVGGDEDGAGGGWVVAGAVVGGDEEDGAAGGWVDVAAILTPALGLLALPQAASVATDSMAAIRR
jgi:hypothetical protein